MKFKGLEFTGDDQIMNCENHKKPQTAWKYNLGHQIANENLARHIKKINEILELLNQIFYV